MVGWKECALTCVEENIKHDTVFVGIGTGRTVPYVLEALKEKTQGLGIFDFIRCVASSFDTETQIGSFGFCLVSFSSVPCLDVVFDGADAVDENLVAIKGGGGAFVKEKRLFKGSKKNCVLVGRGKTNEGRLWEYLGETKKNINIEVMQESVFYVLQMVRKMFGIEGVECSCMLEIKKTKDVKDIREYVFVSENGFFVLEWNPFVCKKHDSVYRRMASEKPCFWGEISECLKKIEGVVSCGLFCGIVTKCYVEGM